MKSIHLFFALYSKANNLKGDILFIPSLWFHNTLTLNASISVNQFFKSLTLDHGLYQKKDLYGNKDLGIVEK